MPSPKAEFTPKIFFLVYELSLTCLYKKISGGEGIAFYKPRVETALYEKMMFWKIWIIISLSIRSLRMHAIKAL